MMNIFTPITKPNFFNSKKLKKRLWKSRYDESITYMNEMEKWFNICIGRFEWKNLPEGITSEKIEKILFMYGSGAFFKDYITNDFYFLPCYNSGDLDVYGNVYRHYVIALNGKPFFSKDKDTQGAFFNGVNSVIVKNTENYYPSITMIRSYVEKMVDIEGAMMNNINVNKSPYIISGSEEELPTLQNTIKNITGNDIALYKEGTNFTQDKLSVLNTDVPYKANLFAESYHEIETRIFTILGINHTAYEKKERLVVDEVKSNDEYLYFNINTALNLRKQACDKINKIFDLNIQVDLRKVLETYKEEPNEEGDEDE